MVVDVCWASDAALAVGSSLGIAVFGALAGEPKMIASIKASNRKPTEPISSRLSRVR
jgi:hypothetical protein